MNVNTEGSGLPGWNRIHWVASYPKSGSTWVRQMVSQYGVANGAGDIRCRFGDGTTYWTQTVSPHPITSMSIRDIAQVRPAALAHMMAMMAVPELVKTHSAFISIDGIPLFARPWMNRVVYVVRDPRDIVASMQSHMGLETPDEAIDKLLDKKLALVQYAKPPALVLDWSTHVFTWLENDVEPPLVVRYEDMHEDPAGVLRGILGHLGFEPDEDRIASAVEATKFQRVRELELQRGGFPERSEAQKKTGAMFFRRGEVGGFRDELTNEQVARVEQAHGEMMERLGYALTTTVAA